MKQPLKQGILTENATGIGTVTRKMVRERAVELAIINGRSAHEASKSDWEQAKMELTGDTGMDLNETILESAPESERWDPVPGSIGHKTPESLGEDEDEEGRSNSERLVEEGIGEAEHDQTLQAAEEAKRRDEWRNPKPASCGSDLATSRIPVAVGQFFERLIYYDAKC